MNTKRDYRSFDYVLVILVCAVAIFGIVAIGSATRINLLDELPAEYRSQRLWFIIGLVAMFLAAFIDYHFITKFYVLIYFSNIFLLGAVLFLVPDTGNDTLRVLRIGPFNILPSEFAKIFMVLYLAKFIDKYQEKFNQVLMLSFILISIIIPVIMVVKQPSLSAGLVTMTVSLIILFAAGLHYRYILAGLAVVAPPSILFYLDLRSPPPYPFITKVLDLLSKVLAEYHLRRINSWIFPDPKDWNYYQTSQSIHAIGSGLLNGKGLYGGTLNQLNYLPASENDFIFAVIGEEFGFIGCAVILTLLFLIILKCVMSAFRAVDMTGRLIAAGVAGMLAFQIFVNIGVATGVLPNTGMALPFISSGGSSMLISMVGIGLVLNVGMTRSKSFFE